jgi:hypothetical protein
MPSDAGVNEDNEQEQVCRIGAGDAVGLLLDLDAGSLAVYLNRERCGLMIQSGLAAPAGFVWGADVFSGYSVRIEHKPPPTVTAEELSVSLSDKHSPLLVVCGATLAEIACDYSTTKLRQHRPGLRGTSLEWSGGIRAARTDPWCGLMPGCG